MKFSVRLLLAATLVCCTAAYERRSFRTSWMPVGRSDEVTSSQVSSEGSDEAIATSVSVESDNSKGDLGVPESFEAEEREFNYYPVEEKVDRTGGVFYEVIDSVRTARGGKKGKKGCKKGKKGKGKKKGKKGKGKKGCGIHGGWWYVWDKKHGYISGRWGDPPPKGLEKEHYHHNFGHGGHKHGSGYDGHGKMGGHKHGHGGHGGGGGGGGGHGGWGWQPKVEHYHHGWASKPQGWGWAGQGGGGGGGGGY